MMSIPGLNPDYFPQSVRELVDVIGLEPTLKLVNERGGTRIFIPVKTDSKHWLNDCIGAEAFTKLVAVYQGMELELPKCQAALLALREEQIAQEFENGATNAELALKYGYTERGIRKLRNRLEQRVFFNAQQDLF